MIDLLKRTWKARFKALKCPLSGHAFVDSRSQPGTQVCVRCKHRRPYETLARTLKVSDPS